MARCASRSFARFLASCSGVRFATPREVAGPILRLLLTWPGDEGVDSAGGDEAFTSVDSDRDIGVIERVAFAANAGAVAHAIWIRSSQ